MTRALAFALFLGLFVVGVALVVWLSRHYRAKGSMLDAKAVCLYALSSFIFVGLSMAFSALLLPGQGFGPRGKELPPEVSGTIPAVVFFICALLVAIGLLLAAAFQFGSSWFRQSRDALRQSAARLAIYGVGALLVALGHLALMRVAPALLQ